MSKYEVSQGHVSNSVFAIGDKARATRKELPSASVAELAAELGKVTDLLRAHQENNPEIESLQRSAKKVKKAKKELTVQKPNPTLIHHLLEDAYNGVAGVSALVDVATKLQGLISHFF
jgi:NADH dehydrogenase FAD-containing subunit